MQKGNPRPVDQARRSAIIKILGGTAALLAFAVGGYALSSGSTSPRGPNESTTTTRSSTVSGGSGALVQSSSSAGIAVRVVYFGMPTGVTGTKKETVTLNRPAYLSDLKTALVNSHPSLKEMLPSMLFLVDGVSANGDPQLQSNVEVDILAQIAGG
jgi:sulfur-carrier protein